MTQKTNITNEITETVAEAEAVAVSHLSQDLRNAVLVVSVLVNLFVFIAWLAIQVTSRYDAQIASFLFG